MHEHGHFYMAEVHLPGGGISQMRSSLAASLLVAAPRCAEREQRVTAAPRCAERGLRAPAAPRCAERGQRVPAAPRCAEGAAEERSVHHIMYKLSPSD